MNIPLLIKTKRKLLRESGTEFGKRFGVTHAAVSEWESGKSEAPYKVIEFVLDEFVERFFCPYCKGTGLLADVPATEKEGGWIGEFAPNGGHDPNNPYPLKRKE